jgi:hypothetical protein
MRDNMKAFITTAVVAGAMLWFAQDSATESPRGMWSGIKEGEIVEALRSPNENTQSAMQRHLERQRLQIASALVRVVESGVNDPRQAFNVVRAMHIMGELRSVETVPFLVKHIGFTYEKVTGGRAWFSNIPAIPALTAIGLPSLEPLIKKVAEGDDEVVRQRAAIVIKQILGRDMAIFFVRDRREREKDEVKRQRLERLVEQIDKVDK